MKDVYANDLSNLTAPRASSRTGGSKTKPAPGELPHCQRAHALEALAYYDRYITTVTALVLMIWVRRFLCRLCRVSVSCLPTFAQPYRPGNRSEERRVGKEWR